MQLAVHEIKVQGVFQTIVPKANKQIGAIRPHIYIKGAPAGNLYVRLTTPDDVLIADSEPVTISEISGAAEYHGYVTFPIEVALQKNARYKLKVIGSDGYSFDENNFCGVCGSFGLSKYQDNSGSNHPLSKPLDFEIWTYSKSNF